MAKMESDEPLKHVHIRLWPDEWESLHEVVSSRRDKLQTYVRRMILADLERNGKKKSEPRNRAVGS